MAALLLFAIALGWAWLTREQVADWLITSQLEKLDLPADYEIESIAPDRQVLRHVVIGDPDSPDLSIEQVIVQLEASWGFPRVSRVTLVQPRLFGSYRDGQLSFGSLDPLLFPEDKPDRLFEFPNLELDVRDARALLESDFGPIGFKAEGRGNLRGGFDGILAATAPELASGMCRASEASLYGRIYIDAEQPGFSGPLRIVSLQCPDQGLSLEKLALSLDGKVDRGFDGFAGRAGLSTGAITTGEIRIGAASGMTTLTFRDGGLIAGFDLNGENGSSPGLNFADLAATGSLRARNGFERVELESELEGQGLRPGKELETAFGEYEAAASDTLLAPLLARFRTALNRETTNSRFSATLNARKTGDVVSLVIPQARIRGVSGQSLLALSSFQMGLAGGESLPRFSGNFASGGPGVPRLSGKIEGQSSRSTRISLVMADYTVGESRLALPNLTLTQSANGDVEFGGLLEASGQLPGGHVQNLELPLSGAWTQASGLQVWQRCQTLTFGELSVSSLTLARRSLKMCPAAGRAILGYGAGGLRIAAGIPELNLAGQLGETPISIATGPVGLAYPGLMEARSVEVRLGDDSNPIDFALRSITATMGGEIGGRFEDTSFRLAAVPLDVVQAGGSWAYQDGEFRVFDGGFMVQDREQVDRFEPLLARDASLRLADNVITADALLREPKSGREVTQVDIRHDLASGRGRADLRVDGLLFDENLQPDEVTPLALGVVANADGVIRGRGQVLWNSEGVTSTGQFATDDFDFAAVFGPVTGLKGEVEFTDLIGLVTAPNQRLYMESINPGIEANAGELQFEIREGLQLVVHKGEWPFLDGTLLLHPVTMNLGVAETRRYLIELIGADAATFVQRMELANIAATGTFDGTVPIVFDEEGGHIDQGRLVSRPPGGNLSYVGELTYEDLGAIANFAFDSLRSLDYSVMDVELNGSLTGEIVTKVRFDGIKQGAGAKRNFITKQIGNLPLRFNVNIRAPFYKLITSVQAMYDPAFIRDPRELGLVDDNGQPLPAGTAYQMLPKALPNNNGSVQNPESETVP